MQMNPKTIWTNDFKMGDSAEYGKNIKLSAPSWDCGWYWGLGYLGNRNCHYHLDGYKKHNVNIWDYLKNEFGESLTITDDNDLWVFCELMSSAYILKETAEFYHTGGARYTTSPCQDKLKDEGLWRRINEIELPLVLDTLETKVLTKYR